MATFDTTRAHFGATGLIGRMSNLVGSVVAWQEARETRKALSKLTDRELDDIGLHRGDISAVAEGVHR